MARGGTVRQAAELSTLQKRSARETARDVVVAAATRHVVHGHRSVDVAGIDVAIVISGADDDVSSTGGGARGHIGASGLLTLLY